MGNQARARSWFVGSLVAATVTLFAITGWLLWPTWVVHRAIAALIRELTYDEPGVRRRAAMILGYLDRESKTAIPDTVRCQMIKLRKASLDPDEVMR